MSLKEKGMNWSKSTSKDKSKRFAVGSIDVPKEGTGKGTSWEILTDERFGKRKKMNRMIELSESLGIDLTEEMKNLAAERTYKETIGDLNRIEEEKEAERLIKKEMEKEYRKIEREYKKLEGKKGTEFISKPVKPLKKDTSKTPVEKLLIYVKDTKKSPSLSPEDRTYFIKRLTIDKVSPIIMKKQIRETIEKRQAERRAVALKVAEPIIPSRGPVVSPILVEAKAGLTPVSTRTGESFTARHLKMKQSEERAARLKKDLATPKYIKFRDLVNKYNGDVLRARSKYKVWLKDKGRSDAEATKEVEKVISIYQDSIRPAAARITKPIPFGKAGFGMTPEQFMLEQKKKADIEAMKRKKLLPKPPMRVGGPGAKIPSKKEFEALQKTSEFQKRMIEQAKKAAMIVGKPGTVAYDDEMQRRIRDAIRRSSMAASPMTEMEKARVAAIEPMSPEELSKLALRRESQLAAIERQAQLYQDKIQAAKFMATVMKGRTKKMPKGGFPVSKIEKAYITTKVPIGKWRVKIRRNKALEHVNIKMVAPNKYRDPETGDMVMTFPDQDSVKREVRQIIGLMGMVPYPGAVVVDYRRPILSKGFVVLHLRVRAYKPVEQKVRI